MHFFGLSNHISCVGHLLVCRWRAEELEVRRIEMIGMYVIVIPYWFPAAVVAVLSVAALGWLVYRWLVKVGFHLRCPKTWNSP